MDKHQFTSSWFDDVARNVWSQFIPQIKPERILEVGSHEGASACFLIDNLADVVDLELHCVDPWEGDIAGATPFGPAAEKRFDHNTKLSIDRLSHPVRLIKHRERSQICLPRLLAEGKAGYFDFVYIDGHHHAPEVLCDAVLGFLLLKVGGHMVFDDYLWSEQMPYGKDPVRCPKPAIDAFTNLYCRRLNVLRAPLYQLYVQKIAE